MCSRAAIVALFVQAVVRAAPQPPPDAAPQPLILKSTSHAVQLDVFVYDSAGQPVHGLRKSDFVVTDNGHPRDIRIFAGEIDADRTPPSSATAAPPGVYSNRLALHDSPIVTAIVIDAVPRPQGLQLNAGMFARSRPEFWYTWVRVEALEAIDRMQPGEMMAIYAVCPDLRVVQDYTSDPGRLAASLRAFAIPSVKDTFGKKEPSTVDVLVPPMLSGLREAVARMAEASGRKSVVWISQAYGTDLKLSDISDATDSTVAAFNNANVPLYAVDTRFNPTCQHPVSFPSDLPGGAPIGTPGITALACSQPPDVSDLWMQYLAGSTGGRAFSGGRLEGYEYRDERGVLTGGRVGLERNSSLVSDALRFAVDDSRYAYQMGFYVPEPELDGAVHTLSVTIPAKPKFDLRHRSGYTASAAANAPPTADSNREPDSKREPASPLHPDEVGIDGRIDVVKNEVRVFLALAPGTVTRAADGVVVLDTTFTQTDWSGKQLAKVAETVRVPSPEPQTEMVRYTRTVKLSNGAVLLHIGIHDPVTNRAGSIAIPIEKQ